VENYYLVVGNFMSKIGEKIIEVPSVVNVVITDNKVSIKGPQGELSIVVPRELTLTREGNSLVLKRKGDEKKTRSAHGLFRQLISNAVVGVEKVWEKKLEVVGTGYTVEMQGEDLVFKIGYSHQVVFKKQPGIKFQVEGNNKVTVGGYDKQMVGQVAYQIKMIKKPDVYKGKGIRYLGEKLRIKPGKKVKAGPAA